MSIATLKKKTQAKYNNVSVNSSTGFSINGTFRNQGYVGQTSSTRSLPYTLMKGPTPRGHGGCCGTYYDHIIPSCVSSLEDNEVVKGSVLTARGMMTERLCENLCNVVKPDNNLNTNTQGDAIARKRKNATDCIVSEINLACSARDCFGKQKVSLYTKPIEAYSPISQGQYLAKLGEKCVAFDPKFSNTSFSRVPFACG